MSRRLAQRAGGVLREKGWSERRDEANGKRVGAIRGTWKILALSLKILEWKRRPGMFFNEPCRLGLGTLRSNKILLSTHCPLLIFWEALNYFEIFKVPFCEIFEIFLTHFLESWENFKNLETFLRHIHISWDISGDSETFWDNLRAILI